LAGDHFLGAAALLIEDHRGELLQRRTRFIYCAAVGIHSGKFLDEADVAVSGLEIHRSEGELSLFHVTSCIAKVKVTRLSLQKCFSEKKIRNEVTLQNFDRRVAATEI